MPHVILTRLLILLCLLSLTPLLSLNQAALTGLLNPSSVLLDGLFSIFPPDFSFFRLRSALLCVFSLFYICCLTAGWHSYFSLTVLLLAINLNNKIAEQHFIVYNDSFKKVWI